MKVQSKKINKKKQHLHEICLQSSVFCSVSQESDARVRQLYDPVIVEALSGITSVLGFSTEIVKLNFCGGTQMIKRNGAISFIGFAEYTCSSSKNRRPESRLKLATLSDPFSVKRLIQQTSQPRVQDWFFFFLFVWVCERLRTGSGEMSTQQYENKVHATPVPISYIPCAFKRPNEKNALG